jgi:EAL and modified HD-GYP domain-containing signal transduction protein
VATQPPDLVFLARQPILDRARRVFAYELLYRPSALAGESGTQATEASAKLISDAVLAFGLEALTHARPAFINVTRDLLLQGIPPTLPAKRVVLELLETIEADEEVVSACRELRRAGYRIALDDFSLTDRTAPLLAVADFVKVDFLQAANRAARHQVAEAGRAQGAALLAEKVETLEEFDLATNEGFDYFQGYFFGRPTVESAREVPADQIGYFRLLSALQDPDLSVRKLERLVEHDASLCFRVLRTVNSAGFGQATRIGSIQQALILLGMDAIRRWVSLWVLAGLNERAHPEVVDMASIRARCCELLALRQSGPDAAPGGFLLGMCSLLDAILARPMEWLLEQLPLPPATAAALRGDDTPGRRMLDCAIAYERGEWDRCVSLAARAGIDPAVLPMAHQDAVIWTSEFRRAA